MKNSGMSPSQINAILEDANNNFIETKKTLTTKYTDALAALIKAKRLMAVVFADVNKDIGLLAATIRLQDFLENYVVAYNESGTDNKLDLLQKEKDFIKGADLTNYMGRIFTIKNAHTGETVQFTNDLIPGYKLTPTLDKIESNLKTNQHSIAID
ncbi:MAG: hypothetical protein MJ200_05855 [Mycoplasmoidaceae bacterium]|nr:hypothetical protein [Mycoplasmoidaceae bacterium]